MAVDTAAKRFSMMGFGGPVPQMVLVPDGTVGASGRADLLYLYSGIALGAAVFLTTATLHYRVSKNAIHYVTNVLQKGDG